MSYFLTLDNDFFEKDNYFLGCRIGLGATMWVHKRTINTLLNQGEKFNQKLRKKLKKKYWS